MEVLHPNPVNLFHSGSLSMASPFPSSNPPTFSQQFHNNYVPFFDNNQTNFPSNSSQPSINLPYTVYSSPNNNFYVNTFPNNTPTFFGNDYSSWNNVASNGRRGIKRKSMEEDPDIPSHQKKTRSWYSCTELDHESIDESTHLPSPSDDSSSKQIVLYQGYSNITNNSNNNFLKTLFESNPLHFFPQHIVEPDTQKALIQLNKPSLPSVWDTSDDSEPERELIKSPRIVELTEDDLDTGEEHIKTVPRVIEATAPSVTLPATPPTSPTRSYRVSPPREEEDEDEEVIVDELNNVVRISKPKSQVVIEEIYDEPQADEPFQGMDIE